MGLRDVKKRLLAKNWIWQTLDSCLCLFVFFPSMVFYWRGIWDLFGVYIFPGDAPKCHWVTAGVGACAIVGYYALPLLSHLLTLIRPPSKPAYVIITRLYMYAWAILAMAYWRGVWGLADYYLLQFGWKAALIGLIVCHGILLLLRSTRTTMFPPFVVSLDTRKDLLVPSTCFRTKVIWTQPKSVVKYTLDSLLTHYVIMTTTIVSWRSSLCLLDIFMFPDDWVFSNWTCLVIGLGGAILVLALETPLSRLADHIQRTQRSNWGRLIFEDIVYIFVFFAESMVWRGGWNLNALYIISDPMVGGWVNHAVGTVLLLSLQLFSYASNCGCGLDGQDARAGDAFYPTKYLRHYLKQPDNATDTRRNEVGVEGISERPKDPTDQDSEICTVSQAKEKEEKKSAESTSNGTAQKMTNGSRLNPAFVNDDDNNVVITHI